MRILVTGLWLVFLTTNFESGAYADEGERDSKTQTLFASGDTQLGRWVAASIYRDGPDKAFEEVKDLIENADIAMTNLECVVSTRGRFWDKGERSPYLYRARPETLDALTRVGFDLVVTANNHAMDYGPEALTEQLEILDAIGIAQVGCGRNKKEAARPTYVRTGDLVVAFIGVEPYFPKFAATKKMSGTFHANDDKKIYEAVKPLILEARKHADLVVFTPHWGDNWTENTSEERIELAHDLIDLGVDAILGHSAHHLHGVEIYKGRPIVYDMGSFFFDTVKTKRLRKSAGFVLEFSKEGFTKLTIYPLLLKSNRTTVAQGKTLDEIKKLLVKLTGEIDPKLKLEDLGNALTVSFKPDSPPPPRKSDPATIHVTGQTKPLPKEIRERKTNVVFDTPPDWTKGFKPIELEGGVVIIGARNSQAVRPHCGFTADIAMKVPGPFRDGYWIGTIKGVSRETDKSFIWRHPIADGGWMPPLWEKGQIVVDRTLVRPPKLARGTWDLYFRFENRTARKVARPKNSTDGDKDGYVRIGEILVTDKGIPKRTAGVAWDGLLPKNGESLVEEGPGVAGGRFAIWISIIASAVLLVAAILIVLIRRRKKRTG